MLIYDLFRKLYLQCKYKKVKISSFAKVDLRASFGGDNFIASKTVFNGYIGRHSYIGYNSYINGYIGNFSSIASNVRLITGKHPVSKFVSTSPYFYKKQKNYPNNSFEEHDYVYKDGKKYSCIIGNDVWIGANVLIKQGVTIGDGAVIAMGAVVVSDIPPYAIYGGNPAKLIRYRFDDNTINELLKSEWWNRDDKYFEDNYELFSDVKKFLK